MNQPVTPELPGTKPPTKEYTWRDPWLQLHMQQRMALYGISGRRGPVKARFPSVGEYQGREVGVGGWVREHPHRSRGRGNGIGGGWRGNQDRDNI